VLLPAALADAAVTQPVSNPDFEFGVERSRRRTGTRRCALSTYAGIDPVNADAQNFLGYAYRNQKKYDLAFRHYSEALRLDPSTRARTSTSARPISSSATRRRRRSTSRRSSASAPSAARSTRT
jgi:tetratricopeptide (TPR) repeat protein